MTTTQIDLFTRQPVKPADNLSALIDRCEEGSRYLKALLARRAAPSLPLAQVAK